MKISDVFDNIGVKLVCLLLAIVVWLYASNEKQIVGRRGPVTFNGVPVQLAGLPDGKWGLKPERISLEVECTTVDVSESAFQAVVNITPADVEKKKVTITAGNVELPEGMKFIKAEPHEIELVSQI